MPARANIQLCSKVPAQRLYQSLACHSLAATAVLTYWLRATPAGMRSAATINLKQFAVSTRRWHTLALLNTIGIPQIRKLYWLIIKQPGIIASGLRSLPRQGSLEAIQCDCAGRPLLRHLLPAWHQNAASRYNSTTSAQARVPIGCVVKRLRAQSSDDQP